MLQSIRERAQGWIAWFIVVLISVPFALWGIQSYLGVGSEPVIATVNGDEITERQFDEAYRNFRQNLREQLGKNYNPDELDDAELRKQVLDSMISNRLLSQRSKELGLRVGDQHVREVIRSNPTFQVGDSFNQQAYEEALRRSGLNPSSYEAQRRAGLVSEQLPKLIVGTEIATQRELEELVKLRQQQRQVEYLTLSPERFAGSIEVSEAEAKAYYESNQDQYFTPERVKLEYLELNAASIVKNLSVDDEVLLSYYEQNKNQYQTPEERRASHILFALEEGADEELVRAKAEGVLKRLQEGESFENLAKELSEDPGSAEDGGDLDYFERGVMAQAFEDAAFSLAKGEVSEPVRTEFGYHVIKVTDIREPQGKSFEQAKENVRAAYLSSEAERQYYEYAERLSEISYEDPNSLQPAAEALGLKLQTSGWVTRDGADGVLDNPKVINAAFSADVLEQGLNSEAIELAQDHMVAVRVIEHELSTPRPFEVVKEQIRMELQQQKASSAAEAKAAEIVGQLRSGKDLLSVAGELGQVALEKVTLNRDSRDTDSQLLQKIFVMPRPKNGQPSIDFASLGDGSVAVVVLKQVTDGSMQAMKELGGEQILKQALQRSRAKSYFEQLQLALRERAQVEMAAKEEE